jgi:hypothetical protein
METGIRSRGEQAATIIEKVLTGSRSVGRERITPFCWLRVQTEKVPHSQPGQPL